MSIIGNPITLGGGTDTGDATLSSAGQLLDGVTAYAKGEKYTGNIPTKHTADLTVNGATVTVPAGYYASNKQKAVASGSAGTPSAAKGTVSNNSISVTPSVTNTTGYITGGTKTGDAVTVSASELVSGTKSITASGSTNVTNYQYASVASGSVSVPAQTVEITPTITLDESTGLIHVEVSGSVTVSPQVVAGYVSSGTAGEITVSGSAEYQLPTLKATEYFVSKTNRTINSKVYLTGNQTIYGVTFTNVTAGNIKKGVTVKIGDNKSSTRLANVTGTYA